MMLMQWMLVTALLLLLVACAATSIEAPSLLKVLLQLLGVACKSVEPGCCARRDGHVLAGPNVPNSIE